MIWLLAFNIFQIRWMIPLIIDHTLAAQRAKNTNLPASLDHIMRISMMVMGALNLVIGSFTCQICMLVFLNKPKVKEYLQAAQAAQ